MAIFNLNPRRILAGLLSFAIFLMYSAPLPVMATVITNINSLGANNNVYNIEAAKVHGHTGFRHYTDFSLDKGDIANLLFKKGNQSYSNFVNLVSNKITINGILNTMKDGSFYNGHVIFVSPKGFVVGSSGVLNVGALSVLTPSQSKFDSYKNTVFGDGDISDYIVGADKYKELLKDSHGTIDINGKILSRGDVELYGDTINIKGTSSDKAGIIAGIGVNEKTVVNTEAAAKTLFDNLVQNNIKKTTNFALENGKVKIVAGYEDTENPEIVKDATVNIENAQIGGSEVKIMANTKTQTIVDLPTDTSSFTEDQINSLAWGVADEATSKVEIKDSEFGAKDVKIEANSVSKTKTNVNLLTPTILNLIINDDAELGEYFSSEVFSGFDGGRANATVKVEDTTINAKNNVEIGTNADVEFEINSKVLGQAIPAILYGLGIKTVSGIDVIGSTISADGDVSLNAISSHDGSLSISNSSLIEMDATNALVLALVNYSNVTDTHAIISGESEIEASSLDVVAINMSESEVELSQTATVGKNDLASASSYGSGAAFSILFNRSKNEVQALIKDSKVTVTSDEADGGGVRVIAQSLNVVSNSIEASASDDNYKHTAPTTFDQPVKDSLKKFKNKYMKHTLKDLFKRGNMDVNMDQADDAKVQASGVFLWNVTNNSATAKIENSTITAKKLDVKSFTVDLLSNEAMTDAVGEAYYGAGIALIINDETNNTTSNIDKNSVVNVDELNMDAITQLPMNAGSIKFGLKLPIAIYGVQDISFGVSMEGDPSGNWDFSGIYPWNSASKDKPAVSWEGFADQNISDTYGALKPKLKLGGFFNNFAQGSGNGNTAALSASVVVNSVENNTTASITGGSNVTVKNGDAVLNAVTSVMGYNAVGIVDYLVTKINYLIPGQQDWKYEPNVNGATAGVGGSVLVDSYTNNATAKIEGSTVDVQAGDLKVRSASEASYLSALATGGTSETFVLDGSVHVQNLHGTTSAEILNSTIKNANNITVDAGNARISPTSSKVEQDNETSELKTKDERDAKDKILNIIATGALAQQSEETEAGAPVPQGSTGTAIGADVNVSHSDRTIRAKIDGSTVTAKENITVNSESKNQTINVAFAGSFAGGVSVGDEQAQGEDNQPMQNAGNWMDMLDNAQPDDDDVLGLNNLFDEDNPNQQGAGNAHEHAGDIDNQNDNVDNDGNINPNQGDNNGNNPGNNNGNMADNQAGPGEAGNNFSLAAAGVVDLYWNTTTIESVLTNSTVTVGKQLNVKSKGDDLYVDVGGGIARAGNVGAGAAVNIYNKSTTVRSLIGDAEHDVSITYTDNSDKQLNVTADDSLLSVGIAVGVGISKNEGEEDDGKKFSLGGSFNMNVLKDTTEAIVQKATVKNKEGVTGAITTNVKSKNDGTIVSVAGGAAYTGGSEQNKGAAAGIAVGWDIVKDTVKAQIIDSTLSNAGNVTVEASLPIKAYSVGIAGAIMNGPTSGYTFDGALITEWYANTVSSLVKGSTITSSGDVNVNSDYNAKNMSLAGSMEFSNAQSGGGLGIGAVIYGEKNNISANTESSTIEKSKSFKAESKSTEDMKFLAANLGMQTNGSKSFRVNGVVSIMNSTTEAKVFNNSTINSNGQVSILADYDNSNQGITVVGEKTKDGMAFGANLIGSYYDNTTQAELEMGSSIITKNENNTNDDVNRDIKISATSKEYINIIPVSIGVASGQGNAVGADIVVNILKSHTNALAHGNLTTTSKLIVKALDDTMIYERGGVLAYAGGTLGIGSIVYYDWLDKTVKSELKWGTEVNAGDITVQATAENSFGGTKKEDGTWDVSDMSTNSSDYGENFAQGSSFQNWNMAYSLAHGDSAGASGAIIVRVLDDKVTANVENVINKSKSLTIYANDYTIMNTIVGEFNPSNIGVGGSVLVVVGESDTKATMTDGTHTLTGDLSVNANTEKIAHTVLIGGSGGDKVGINGSVYVNKLKDKITSSIIGSNVTANKVSVNANQRNDNLGVSVSVAGSGKFSLG
ncbi:MAG: leukotoxin LktA family filamentous adhesin, partial [Cyanobacteria bacterium RUI128]|nr:leukotoxin LktA family filamentous adhesin [Cyanobacteria bacterium RUI128]